VQLAVAAAEASGAEDAVTAAAIAAGMPAHMRLAAGPPSSISPQAMTRFASQGFRFVGVGKTNPKFKVSALVERRVVHLRFAQAELGETAFMCPASLVLKSLLQQ
jgi:hypothetical protein